MTRPTHGATFRAAEVFGRPLMTALFATVRTSRSGTRHFRELRREGTGILFVCWHDQLLPLVRIHRDEGVVVLVSEHADGEYITRVLRGNGFETVRGSSTRGGTRGLRAMIRVARGSADLAVTPDGPRGPRHRITEEKHGALLVAQRTGRPIVPVGMAASSAWRLGSWDRFMIPRPFSRIHVCYGPPLRIPGDADGADRAEVAAILEETLCQLTREAADILAGGDAGDGRPKNAPGERSGTGETDAGSPRANDPDGRRGRRDPAEGDEVGAASP